MRRVFATGKQRNDALAAVVAFSAKKAYPHDRLPVFSDFNNLVMDESRLDDDTWYFAFINKLAALLSSAESNA